MKNVFAVKANPLKIMTFANYVGDFFIIWSGMGYGNPVRAASAATGALAGTAGLLSDKDGKFLGADARTIVMSGILIGAIGYIVSGSNVLGFEKNMRITEMLAGGTLATAATLNLNNRPKLGGAFFLATSGLMGSQTIETLLKGETDWKMLAAFLSFVVSNSATFFIKRKGSHGADNNLRDITIS